MAYSDVSSPTTSFTEIDLPIGRGIRERMVVLLMGFDVPTDLDLTDSDDRYRWLTKGFYPGTGVPAYASISDPSTTHTDIGPSAGAYGHGLYGAGFYGGAIAHTDVSDSSTAYSDVGSP